MPETVSNGDGPRVGIDASGNVTFLYDIVNSGGANGEFVREAAAGSAIIAAPPHTLSSTCSGFDADLAVAANGDAIAGFCGSVAFALRKAGLGTATTPFVQPQHGVSEHRRQHQLRRGPGRDQQRRPSDRGGAGDRQPGRLHGRVPQHPEGFDLPRVPRRAA